MKQEESLSSFVGVLKKTVTVAILKGRSCYSFCYYLVPNDDRIARCCDCDIRYPFPATPRR